MSLPNSNSEINGIGIPQLYLLQMDAGLNLRGNDTQVLPLHLLNSISDCNQKQLLQLKQIKIGEQDQHDIDLDSSPDTSIKFVTIQAEKDYIQDEAQAISPYHIQHRNVPPNLPSSMNSKHPLGKVSETELLPTSLLNSSPRALPSNQKSIQNYVHISDRSVLPRAVAVLPTALQIRRHNVISPRRILPPRARFGPVQGVKHEMSSIEISKLVMSSIENQTPLFVYRNEKESLTAIDVTDKDKSNWIGLLPLGDDNTANVWIYEENSELFVITTEAVPSRKQLMLGYSKKYAQDFGLIGPTKEIETESPIKQKSWWCYECQRAMSSAALLQRHMDINHQEDNMPTRRRYRCRHCTRTFSRIFTLRRHVAQHCEKKISKSEANVSTETLPDVSLNSCLNTDDTRVPSDESFQNYSNGLDFSTNLFDTDRMPSLYLSGNSRCEFNPYGLDNDSPLTSVLGYANGCSNKTEVSPSSHNKKQPEEDKTEPSPVSCPYCKQDIARGKKRQHVSECPARRFECECKKIFPNKEKLAMHIFTQHSNEKAAEEEERLKAENNTSGTNTTESSTPYRCEECEHTFKRRGMLVNHLWRVHKTAAARVPLERRVRHYPCAACPKIYRTAAKRDRHVTVHHPGLEQARAAPLDGGTRACSPAPCAACPRQYATRAKLLQHMRLRHPHLVPPPSKKANLTQKSNTNERLKASEELSKNKTNLQQLLNFY